MVKAKSPTVVSAVAVILTLLSAGTGQARDCDTEFRICSDGCGVKAEKAPGSAVNRTKVLQDCVAWCTEDEDNCLAEIGPGNGLAPLPEPFQLDPLAPATAAPPASVTRPPASVPAAPAVTAPPRAPAAPAAPATLPTLPTDRRPPPAAPTAPLPPAAAAPLPAAPPAAAPDALEPPLPPWNEEEHNSRPTRPEDRALRPGALTVHVEAGLSDQMTIVAENGFPFAVRLTTLETIKCVHIRPSDCGVVARGAVVPAGQASAVYTVKRINTSKPSSFEVRFQWEPATRTAP